VNYISSTLGNEDLSKVHTSPGVFISLWLTLLQAVNDIVSINDIINGFSNHLQNIIADDGHPPAQEASKVSITFSSLAGLW
jgi:hypothetical protein